MSNFLMQDSWIKSYKKSEFNKTIRQIKELLNNIKTQKEEMYWNRKRMKLLIKVEKEYMSLLEYLTKEKN